LSADASSVRHAAVAAGAQRIQHVVIIIQENRSFDNLFQAYPGADSAPTGKGKQGNTIALVPVPLEAPYDIDHYYAQFATAVDNGKMDGFGLEHVVGQYSQYAHPQYAYVPPSETQLYFAMAQQYVLADRMFPSNVDGSFVAHQYAIAGQSQSAVDYPSGFWGCDGGTSDTVPTLTQQRTYGPVEQACFDYKTIADELDAKGLTWRFYAPFYQSPNGGVWSAFQAVKHIRQGPEWKTNVIWPETTILQDVPNGILANVTWVTPDSANSDHPRSTTGNGPNWVASVVNAIGRSPFWNSTAIFVFWDEWGGFYDHVPPPTVDYDGLGIRVPLLCISPYAGKGVVSHVQYETASILKFIEGNFGLPTLSASDRRATSAGFGCLTRTTPRPFTLFQTTLKPKDFLRARPSLKRPDDA
jgi:phospholipase C